MIVDGEQKIARPRQVYLGYDQRDYIAIDSREQREGKAAMAV